MNNTESGNYFRSDCYFSHICGYGNGLSGLHKATVSAYALGPDSAGPVVKKG